MQPPSMKKNFENPFFRFSNEKEELQTQLLSWYDDYKRDLPWRRNPSLYKTVVSEFMLQQTRVSTVLPYFDRWLKKFPCFEDLASAPEDRVLKAWEGLGYYSRARNLHKLAREFIAWKVIPHDPESWQKLPGVGPYISAAVTSISFDQNVAVCDGNVVRVLSRIFSIDESFKDGSSAQRKLFPLAQTLIDEDRPGDYNQAVMELGATICNRQSPLCTICPVLKNCKSGQKGDPETRPKLQKKKKRLIKLKRYWIESGNSILLQKGGIEEKRLSGLFELPKNLEGELEGLQNLLLQKNRTIGTNEYKETIYKSSIKSSCDFKKYSLEWITWENFKEITLSGPHRKWIQELRKDRSNSDG